MFAELSNDERADLVVNALSDLLGSDPTQHDYVLLAQTMRETLAGLEGYIDLEYNARARPAADTETGKICNPCGYESA